MINYPDHVKNKLMNIVEEMAKHPEYYVKNPKRDFTRKRKLNFKSVIEILLSIGGGSISNELLKHFNYDATTASSSAFVQQRDKILPSTFEILLDKFTNSFDNLKTYNGYRLLAVDGSALNIAHNPKDVDSYCQSSPDSKGYNLLHLNAVYDLCNKLYIDAFIQSYNQRNEFRALTDMVGRSKTTDKSIFIADRGYESYNVFANIEKMDFNYLIRVKDVKSRGIASSLILPDKNEFDTIINLKLTRRQTNEIKAHPEIYKFLPKNTTFDFLKPKDRKVFPISFRVVRFKISENNYETIITNLNSSEFPSSEIKKLYHMRWGIETSFRELKYALGLINFHSKKVDYIFQEVFAKLVMYNFCEIITLHVVITQKYTKHTYQVNFTMAMQICRHFFKCLENISPPDVEALIRKYILPIRDGRKDQRKLKPKTTISFNYRVA
ncbi:MAG: IS4 family transposase [Clostridiaceae bacterium]